MQNFSYNYIGGQGKLWARLKKKNQLETHHRYAMDIAPPLEKNPPRQF